ncbi:putative G2/M phase-specific E3 ubiquitin-protein ligase-like [Apostichopus japonicus]|uniref:HECT-type E3 ubiquitin transferase n=1 Tax=Stichopus japonicus TaxID=307972 RepID=A0A2G8KT30_STIJA|nr:putative G2/M phase-specific E3 ubiquitin-protein ligase-like [Apostichopus japonicus]
MKCRQRCSSQTTLVSAAVERRNLFRGVPVRGGNNDKRKNRKAKEVAINFFALSRIHQTKIPPNFTQAGLTEAGLGNKKVLLSSNATPLEAAGSSSSNPLVDLMEKCKSCNSDVPQTLLRQHVKTCVSRRQLRMQDITDTTSTIPVTSDDSDSDFPEILSSDEGTATPAVGLHPSCLQSSQTTDNQSTLGTTHPQAGTSPTTTTVVGMVTTMTSVDHPYSLSSNTPRTEAQIINSRPSPTALSPTPTLSTTTSSTHSMASTSGEQNTNYNMRSLPSTSASGTTHYEDDENVSYRSYLQDCIDVHDMSDADMEEDAQLNRAIAESLETYSKRDDVTSASLLLTLNQKIHNNSVFRFNVNRLHLWECAVRGFKRLSFAGDKRIVVHFTDSIGNIEGAVDQGGPLREFLRLMMKNLQKNNSVFDGPLDRRFLRMNTNDACNKLLLVWPSHWIIQSCWYHGGCVLIHGGPAPHFFSRSLFNIVSYGFEAAAPLVEEVSDPETKLLIEAIVNATSTEELNDAIESASFLMGLAGIIRVNPSLPDKESIAKELIQFLVIDRARSAYESFLEGLSTMGLLDLIRSHPLVMEECFMQSDEILTASRMERLFSHDLSPEGSNRRMAEARTLTYWLDMLIDIDDKQSTISHRDILIFATGLDTVPAIGFQSSPQLQFLHDAEINEGQISQFPKAHTCACILKLPIHNSYELFKEKMEFGILSAAGFGEP